MFIEKLGIMGVTVIHATFNVLFIVMSLENIHPSQIIYAAEKIKKKKKSFLPNNNYESKARI
jgi:hypothetical protein